MKIVQLKAENFKRLKAIDLTLTPEESMIEITGRNAQGKTSLLDSIAYALGGGNYVPEKPIREGEKKSQVYLDLGDMKITKVSTSSGERLEITNADGLIYKSPQAILDHIKGKYTFDPLEFSKSKNQKETLLNLLSLEIDLDVVAKRKKEMHDERTIKTREWKQLEAEIIAVPQPEVDLPEQELTTQAVMEELEASRQAEKAIQEKLGQIADIEKRIEGKNAKIESLRARIKEVEAQIAQESQLIEQFAQAKEKAQVELMELPKPVDIEDIKGSLREIELTNQKIRDNQKRLVLVFEAQKKQTEINSLTVQLKQIEAEKEQALNKAQFPIEGLGFDETGVIYQGIPFSQIAESEKLKVSMAIAMALNPTLRIIRITDGSLLDNENMAILAEMAADKDYQVWIERVDETGEVGIYIEDGEVKKVNKPRKKINIKPKGEG